MFSPEESEGILAGLQRGADVDLSEPSLAPVAEMLDDLACKKRFMQQCPKVSKILLDNTESIKCAFCSGLHDNRTLVVVLDAKPTLVVVQSGCEPSVSVSVDGEDLLPPYESTDVAGLVRVVST